MRKTILVLLIVIVILSVLLVATKLGLTAYVAWMEENHFRQPSEKDMQRIIDNCSCDIFSYCGYNF